MDSLATILEQELEGAVEVKDKRALHRYILLLTENLVREDRFAQDVGDIKSDVRVIAESMKQGFANTDRRIADMTAQMDKRFQDITKLIDQRFEDANTRFETMNQRFEDMNQRFEDTNLRFEDMNQRFEQLTRHMDQRFADANLRFEDMNKRFDENGKRTTSMFTYLNIILGVLVLITVLFKFV